jgi:hypothetical protein
MTTINKTLATPGNNFFDLLDFVAGCHSAYIAAEMASSCAWRIDTMIVSAARQSLKFIKDELFQRGGYETMAEINAAMADAEFAEINFLEIGSSNTGPIEMMRALNAHRDQWHDLASRLVPLVSDYRGQPMVYTTPDISSVFHKDPALRVNETTQRRLKIRSERMAQAFGVPELADEAFKRSLERKEDSNKRVSAIIKDTAPIAELMFQFALRNDESSAALRSKDFWTLPIEAQRTLIDNASNAAMRADERAADDRSMSETEYDMISLMAIKSMTQLKSVLSAPRFKAPAMEPSNV